MSEPLSPFPSALEPESPHKVWIIQPPRRRLWIHIVLLLATFVSTMVVGARIQDNFARHQPAFSLSDDSGSLFPVEWIWEAPTRLMGGLPFSLTLMFILLAHEMGHYFYARRYHVYATLPYFIPFPSLIGTLGAFIRIKSQIPSRAALFDIGIAGPIAGFVPSSIAMLVGLAFSRPLNGVDGPYMQLGFPLAFRFAAHAEHIRVPLALLSLHPIAVAAWVGMFATALNLLPGGQLDGGHITFSIAPKWHRLVTILTVCALIPLTRYSWKGWLLWAVVLAMAAGHPAVPDRPAVSGRRRWVALFGLLMLVLCFTPTPLTQHPYRPLWPDLRDEGRQAYHWAVDGARQWLHRK